MDRRSTQLARRIGGGAFLLALAVVFGRSLSRPPEPEPPLEETAVPKAAVPASPAAAAGAAIATQPEPPRPLDVADVPAPGAPRRAPAKGAAPEEDPAVSASRSYARGAASFAPPSFPSGGNAPTAAAGSQALVSAPQMDGSRSAPNPPQAAAPGRNAPPAGGGGRPPSAEDGGLAADGRVGAATSNFLAEARRQKEEAAANPMAAGGIGSMILRGVEAQDKIDSQLRSTIADMQAAGTATPEALQKAAADVIAANGGGPAEPEDVAQALGRASGPPAPQLPPQAYAAAAQQVFSGPPLTPQQQQDVVKLVEDPPRPRGPAPKNAIQAFQQNRSVFDRAMKEYGVKPEIILGILGVESDYGRGDMGKLNAGSTLNFLMQKYAGQARGKQAAADAAALVRLKAQGQLGPGPTPSVNWAGATGAPQFLFSSWEAYGRGVGPKRDPYSLPDSILSVANYLKVHGYSQDVGRSILAYNHSTEYENKVLATAARVKPAVDAAIASGGTPGATARP